MATVSSDLTFLTNESGRMLSQPKANGQDRRAEDEAVRAIRMKWNSCRNRQNARIQACLQLGEELRRHTDKVPWGTCINRSQALE